MGTRSSRRRPHGDIRPRRLATRRIYRGEFLTVHHDRVRLPGGHVAQLDRIEHPAAVTVVPILADGRVVLIRQWRAAIGKYLWELPAGKLARGETPRQGAARELAEETGYRARSLKRVLGFFPAPGFSTEWMTLYAASDLTQVGAHPEADEVIRVHACSRAQVARLVKSGAVADAKSLIGLLAWLGAWVS